MRKRGISLKENIVLILLLLVILGVLSLFLFPTEKIIFRAPPTFHEFYGTVKCLNNQNIINGLEIIGKLGNIEFRTQVNNGQYQLFVQNGNNDQNIDFYLDRENIQDELFQSFGLTQKNIVMNNAYCSTNPAIYINIPVDNQQLSQYSVDVIFTNFNFIIGSIGETHLHLYIDTDNTPYMFYNGVTNRIEYNGIAATNIIRTGSNSLHINNLANGVHQLKLILAQSSHVELLNSEAIHFISFNVNVQEILGDGGNGGGGSSGGGGGGGSSRKTECNDGKDNDNDTRKDFPIDPGCLNKQDDNEQDPIQVVYKCVDRLDNDNDTLTDMDDPGCINIFDNSEENSLITKPELPVQPMDEDTDNKLYPIKDNKKIQYIIATLIIILCIALLVTPKLSKMIGSKKS